MTEQERYRRGLEKLGLGPVRTAEGDQGKTWVVKPYWPDVRTDPAFAWRVLEAFWKDDALATVELLGITTDISLTGAVYRAVCELGEDK